MKLTLTINEILALFRDHFPPSWTPEGTQVREVETKGYPVSEIEIVFENKKE